MVRATIGLSCSPIGERPVANSRAKCLLVGVILRKRASVETIAISNTGRTSQFRERMSMSQAHQYSGLV
jgi:hypothetical protein